MAAAEEPISAAEARSLFSDLESCPALILAVSGGPDSTALLVLAARWRAALKRGPELIAVTVDHGLRPESAAEARAAKRLATSLGIAHRTLRWRGEKPATALQEKAREARYRLLAAAACRAGANHVLTAHTLDDQAETVLFRLARGSGITGLAGMVRQSPLPTSGPAPSPPRGEGWGEGAQGSPSRSVPPHPKSSLRSESDLSPLGRGEEPRGLRLVRPFLDIPKARLIATLRAAKIPFAEDPSNLDPRFTRVRLRSLLPELAQEGLDVPRLALLAKRLRRADAALEAAAARATAELAMPGPSFSIVFDAGGWARLAHELRLRLLCGAVARLGDEGPVELGKLEACESALAAACAARPAARFRRTLAGAMITLSRGRLTIERAPARRKPRKSAKRTRAGSKPVHHGTVK